MTAELPKQMSWKLELTTLGLLTCLFTFGKYVGAQSTFPGDCTTLHSKSEQNLIKEEKKKTPTISVAPFPKTIYEGHYIRQQFNSVQTSFRKIALLDI